MTERGRTARNRLCSARRAGAPPGGARAPSRGRSEVTGPCPAPPGPGDPSQRPTVGQATSQPPGGRFLEPLGLFPLVSLFGRLVVRLEPPSFASSAGQLEKTCWAPPRGHLWAWGRAEA